MSYADQVFRRNCRGHFEKRRVGHGTCRASALGGRRRPAHTVKKFGIVNRYDLSEGIPASSRCAAPTGRPPWTSCLWIWQKKSNNIHDLRGHIWDAWADESGSIGKAYGYQLGVKHQYHKKECSIRWTACSTT